MKYSTAILTTVTLTAALVLSACDGPSNRMENADNSEIEANRDVEGELRMYRAENADRIMEYNRTISEIKQDIEDESDMDVRVNHETMLEEYEETHRELKREIDNYSASGRENWDDFKDSFSSRMDDLGDSLEDFFSNTNTTSSTNQP